MAAVALIPAPLKRFEIWREGSREPLLNAPAEFLGEAYGDSFEHACRCWAARVKQDLVFSRLEPGRHLTIEDQYGCRLFDNEKAAREMFG